MMKKIIFISIFILLAPYLSARAFTIKVVDGSFVDRYLGSIIVEDSVFQKKLYYLDPETKQKFFIAPDGGVRQLLEKFAEGSNDKIISRLPENSSQKNADLNYAKKFSGKFLLNVNKNGEVWYVDPLSLQRYYINTDNTGYNTLERLALNLTSDKMSIIANYPVEISADSENNIDFSLYNQVRDILKENFYQEAKIEDKKLFYGSLAGLAQSLDDPYTVFFSPQDKQEFNDKIDNAVEGIGALVDLKNNVLTIITPITDSPAIKAGLLPNDQILEVDNTSIRGFSIDKSISLIKGQKGTAVKLKIYRQATDETFEVNITRDRIVIPNVSAKDLGNNIAYFAINTFSPNMVNDFNEARKQFINEKTKGIIIDLRNNPGGYTDSAVALADLWLPADTLILREKAKKESVDYLTRTKEDWSLPTVILVNSGTASAAEIFSAALWEHGKAKIVGETTYGKGTGQMVNDFPDGSALKYTYFEWFTGEGKSVENRGIKPDFEISNNKSTIDFQLNKALELLK